jgi:glycosyl transferase, family 25
MTTAAHKPAPLHWFVINLDRSTDRLDAITGNLAAAGVAFTRVPAVDGWRLTVPIPGVDPARFRRTQGRNLRLSDIGNYLSHLRTLRAFLDTPHQHAMVLEDDAVVTAEAVRLAEMLTAPDAPDDWDMIKFEAHHISFNFRLRSLFGAYRLCAQPTRPTGCAAYLINRAGAAALLNRLLPMQVMYDHAFDRGWALNIRVRTILPLPIQVSYACASTMSTAENRARKVAWWQKGPVLLWRAGTEIMRLASALYAWALPTRRFPWPVSGGGGEALQRGGTGNFWHRRHERWCSYDRKAESDGMKHAAITRLGGMCAAAIPVVT